MKAAFACWGDRIAPVLDTARQLHVVEAEDGNIVRESLEALPGEPPAQMALRLVELGVATLVCGAVSRPLHRLVVAYGIDVVPFVAGLLADVVAAWVKGGLDGAAFAMPGCCGRWARPEPKLERVEGGGRTMKVVFTAAGDDLGAPLDTRFGRAPKFLVYDLDGESFRMIDNHPNLNAAQGAGIQAAETVARLGARALVTGHCGPKAFRVLLGAGVKVYNTDAGTVAEALRRYRAGELEEATAADVDGHWDLGGGRGRGRGR